MSELTHHRGEFNGIELHWVEQGDGRPVVLLHGFPEFWYSWRRQLPVLAEAGFRAIAPDLRGYNESAKPSGVKNYDVLSLADDVIRFIEQLGGKVPLVGHDWGGAVAWRVARVRPDLLTHLVILNVPHPRTITHALRTPRQLARLWYQFAMQPPALPEWVMRRNDYALLRRTLRGAAARRDAINEDEIARYVEAWSRPGALTAMTNYYRALFRHRPKTLERATTPQEPLRSLLIWGEQDVVFLRSTAALSADFMPGLRIEWIPEAGHFVQWDAPERVNSILLEFLRAE